MDQFRSEVMALTSNRNAEFVGRRVSLGSLAILCLALLTVGCGGGTSTSSVNNALPPPPLNELGTVASATPVSCADEDGAQGGVTTNASCLDVMVSCPGVADQPMGVKVNAPDGPSLGTVLFTVGGGGRPWYDVQFTYGITAVGNVRDAGFTTVQLNWWEEPIGFKGGTFAGWLTGPADNGPNQLACRWATVAKWVHDNPAITPSNSPFCATGNSAGSAAAAYAIAQYKLDSIFNFLEETSGPPLSRLDHGCMCNTSGLNPCYQGTGAVFSECYQMDANLYIDPAYDPKGKLCSNAEDGRTTHEQLLINDSILAPGAKLDYPNIDIHFLFGGQDDGSSDPLAMEWIPLITAKAPITVDCVADAGHPIADVLDGATTIADDIIARCHQ